MSTPSKRVKSGLGGAMNLRDTAPATSIPPINTSTTTTRNGSNTPSRVIKRGQGTTTKPSAANLPDEVVSGLSPIKRSGSRRIGVSRKYNDEVVKTTIVLPTVVHDKLTELVYRNRKTSKDSLNDLVMQGLDTLFQDFGLEPIDEMVRKAEEQKANEQR